MSTALPGVGAASREGVGGVVTVVKWILLGVAGQLVLSVWIGGAFMTYVVVETVAGAAVGALVGVAAFLAVPLVYGGVRLTIEKER